MANWGEVGTFRVGIVVSGGTAGAKKIVYAGSAIDINNGGLIVADTGAVTVGATGTAATHYIQGTYDNDLLVIRNAHASTPIGAVINFSAAAPDNNTQFFLKCSDNAATRALIYADGDVWTSDAGTLTSDARLKTNIQHATPKLADILKLTVRNFEWIPEYHPEKIGQKKIGFIAQEFENVFPTLVNEHEFDLGEERVIRKSIRYGALIPILTKAIQELNDKIETLEARIQ